ncbi:hypothetical protein NDU88_001465 [Pleurodeles waltl]|uniref:Uncharacterized protein n=1 Tax=Pleurodeles waltl TaxID=8319 RepID=A0AAV7THV0_PLEWA|nr:hypothetical protein NDU88_001465 [Pleurodeles waltl]
MPPCRNYGGGGGVDPERRLGNITCASNPESLLLLYLPFPNKWGFAIAKDSLSNLLSILPWIKLPLQSHVILEL